jgi:hypothetical protein
MADKWRRRRPRCRRARPERELRPFRRYGSRRFGEVLPSGFRCRSCGHRGDGWEFRFASPETGAQA